MTKVTPITAAILPHPSTKQVAGAYKEVQRDIIDLTPNDAALIEAIKHLSIGAAMFKYLIKAGTRPTASQIIELYSVNENIADAYERIDFNEDR